MKTVVGILLILCMIGAVVMVVRGVIIWARESREEMLGNSTGPSQSGLRQNKMMWRRIQFQAMAVVLVVLLLLMAKGSAG